MSNKAQILGLGAVCKDWVSVVPYFPKPDEKIDGISENYFPGGVTANYITGVGRLGVPCSFIGAVGNDSSGDYLIDDFKNEGVYTEFCLKKDGMNTGVNFILVNKNDGQKMIIQSPHFNKTRLSVEDLRQEWFKGAKLLHTTAIHHELTIKAIDFAVKENLKISFDLESQIAIRGMEELNPILKHVNILLPNKMGLIELVKADTPLEAAQIMLEKFPNIEVIVITLGEKGAMGITKNNIIEVPAIKLENIVDATGAGDTFCAAFTVAYVIKKWSLEKSLLFANGAAARKCLQLGARTGMGTYNEIILFLKENGYEF